MDLFIPIPYLSLFFVRLPDQLSFVRFSMVYAMAFFDCLLKESGFSSAVTQFGILQYSTTLTAKDCCLIFVLAYWFTILFVPAVTSLLTYPTCAPSSCTGTVFLFFLEVSLVPATPTSLHMCSLWKIVQPFPPPSMRTYEAAADFL